MAEQTEKPKPDVVFFLGAGASVFADVPDTQSFVSEFINQLTNQNDKKVVKLIVSKLNKWLKTNKKDAKVDIELLMETLDKLSRKEDEPLLEFYENKEYLLVGYSPKKPILEQLKTFVKSKAIVSQDDIGYLEPFLGFIKEYHSIDIFSVNYDICIEQFCDYFQKSYRDGFEAEWNPTVFSDLKTDIRLYKLHGSVTWYKTSGGGFLKSMVVSDKAYLELYTGEKAESLMLYPIRKWEYAEPFLENLLALKNKLQADATKYCIVVGYSFRDDYVRDIFGDSAKKNKELILILVDPNAFSIYSKRLEFYSTGVPSSIKERVICLPFLFENIFPNLRTTFLNNLKEGVNFFNQAKETELSGISTPKWAMCLRSLANAHYVDKLDEIITEKLHFRIKRSWGGSENRSPEDRANDVRLLYSKFNRDIALMLEILFKRCIALYSNDRKEEGNECFLDFTAALHLFLVEKLSVAIDVDGIVLKPNTEGAGYHPTQVLAELIGQLTSYGIEDWFDSNKTEKLQELTQEIESYLREWGNEKLKYETYKSVRSSSFMSRTTTNAISKISKVIKNIHIDLNNSNLSKVKELNSLILQTERRVITKIIGKYTKDLLKSISTSQQTNSA